jgi:hypothetical protein
MIREGKFTPEKLEVLKEFGFRRKGVEELKEDRR